MWVSNIFSCNDNKPKRLLYNMSRNTVRKTIIYVEVVSKKNRNALFSLYILYMPVIWNLRDGLNWTKLNRYLTFIGNAGKIVVCGMKYISKKPTSYRLKIRSNAEKHISKIMIVSSSSANYHSILKALFICAVFVACCCFDKVAHVR